jgi:hypothetical protein
MTQKDWVFVVDVVVIDLMWKMVALSVINRLAGAIVKFNAIVKICKYKRFHEGRHFIPMAMEVHDTFGRDMDISLGSVPIFFTIDNQEVIYFYFFAFNFLGNVLMLFFSVL